MKKFRLFNVVAMTLIIVAFTSAGFSKSLFEDSYNAAVLSGQLIEQGYSREEAHRIADEQIYGIQSSNSNLYSYMDRECN